MKRHEHMADRREETIAYYDKAADAYAEDTATVDMQALYEPFLRHLPLPAKILDGGCGSGRDTKAFIARGHELTAFDASAELTRLASRLTGIAVLCMRFSDVAWSERFDGIWCCASLLHLPLAELPAAFERLGRALVIGGVLYVSFKKGSGERRQGQRYFTDLNEQLLHGILDRCGQETVSLELGELWYTKDCRHDREDEWLNALVFRRR